MQHHHFTGQKTETITSDNTKVNATLLEENNKLKQRIKELEFQRDSASQDAQEQEETNDQNHNAYVQYYKHCEKLEERIRELEMVISEMETTKPNWISVKEREPEDLNVVVCIDKKGRPKLMQSLGIENWQEYDNWFNDPTHWMPLPPPPTTEKSTTDEEG